MSIIPPSGSLVRFDNPTLITAQNEKDRKALGASKQQTALDQQMMDVTGGAGTSSPQLGRKQQAMKDLSLEEILDKILPPKITKDPNNSDLLYCQRISSTPATRLDVINLQEQLDMRLQQRQARETGICPVRRELFSQCFDELIRQVAINCAERGLLLLRVRDELQMTLRAYQTLYESSVAFGMRKALMAEQGKSELERKLVQLEEDKRDLERQLKETKANAEAAEKKLNEQRQVEEKKHMEEINFLKKTNQQLKAQLEEKRQRQSSPPPAPPPPSSLKSHLAQRLQRLRSGQRDLWADDNDDNTTNQKKKQSKTTNNKRTYIILSDSDEERSSSSQRRLRNTRSRKKLSRNHDENVNKNATCLICSILSQLSSHNCCSEHLSILKNHSDHQQRTTNSQWLPDKVMIVPVTDELVQRYLDPEQIYNLRTQTSITNKKTSEPITSVN
ncbi:unnamed protein product [Rotaria sp. Silwood2]|nr:unnamed protein product [Rotaria sp. Silwood2]CAF2843844.1 unnamed protein product [Rotaria sp. Silwood2]